jgi:hypothetical protein
MGTTLRRLVRFLAIATVCWLGMQWVHEAGHALGCRLSGGHIERVVLTPWTFSRTDPADDPHPLVTGWGGPVLGVLFPLLAHLMVPRSHLVRVFAAFCLFANGTYIFFAAFTPLADAATLRRHGAPLWSLLLFGLAAMTAALPLTLRANNRQLRWHPAPLTRPELLVTTLLLLTLPTAGTVAFPDSP